MSILSLWWHLGTLKAQVWLRTNSLGSSPGRKPVQVTLWSISRGCCTSQVGFVCFAVNEELLPAAGLPRHLCSTNSIAREARASVLIALVSTATPRGRRQPGRA